MKHDVIIVGAPSLPTSEAMLAAARGCAAPSVVIVDTQKEERLAADVFNPNESDLQYMLRRMKELGISKDKQHNDPDQRPSD